METASNILDKLEKLEIRKIKAVNNLVTKHGLEAVVILEKYLHEAKDLQIGGPLYGIRTLLKCYVLQTDYAFKKTKEYYRRK
jgi:hypothetical protein